MATEEERAVEFRRMMQAREDNRAGRERDLAAPPGPLEALKLKTYALLGWGGWDPVRKVTGDVKGEDWAPDDA